MPRLPLDGQSRRRPSRRSFIRVLCPYIIVFVLFSLSLAEYGYLSARFPTPARSQHLGWQAWDAVRIGDDGSVSDGSVAASLPLDVWDPMAAHTTGLTEIAFKSCLISPKVTSICWPKSTPEEDMAKGKWVLVDSDINGGGGGYWNLYMYYRRTRRLDVDLIHELRMWPEPPPPEADVEGWAQAAGDLRTGSRRGDKELRLWYKASRQSDNASIVTEIMPHFGEDEPFFGFERVEGGGIATAKKGKWHAVDLVYRQGNPVAPPAPVPTFHNNGTFKIMQIADLHYSVGTGECRDTDKAPCEGDADTATWLAEALDAEQPDLVVFSGDQLNGQKTSFDSTSVLAKFAKPVMDRKIPWAAVFGNHDSEIAHDRMAQMRALQLMPYSLARAGPLDIDGVGNYHIQIQSPDQATHLFTLYFIDSGAYQPTIIPWTTPDYDYIQDSQVEWFRNLSASIQPIQKPYKSDKRSHRNKRDSKPNAIAWWHIPLQEAYNTADVEDGETLNVGSMLDGEGASRHPSTMFAALKDSEVKITSHGHCHLTDRCRRVSGVWMCFDGGSSFSGYGLPEFDRRVRVYELSEWGELVSSYKRTFGGEILDRQVLVGQV